MMAWPFEQRDGLAGEPTEPRELEAFAGASTIVCSSSNLSIANQISCWHGYAPFQSVRNKFESDFRI